MQLLTPRDLRGMLPGQCFYVPIVDETGGMLNDPVAVKLAEDRWWISIADSGLRYWVKGLAYGFRLDVLGDEPDVSPLAQDFDLLSSSQSMQMSMINGRSTSSRGWQFVLGPKRTGKLSVPAIRIGGATTKPLELEVLPAAASQAGDQMAADESACTCDQHGLHRHTPMRNFL